ncbi:PREDICTED: auxin-responsive protein SAUR21-like [Tarenaya hassleriana]|uniref:auxin-responsive protein SAUR21-like n=1 Tax=Tarenaya hassleriana TaxID=28532 RepID=UPI00053C110F|nr:PREDICTED: auxin-responsive protein SAUR21-like [Tarenaya hassleriana]
MIFIYTVPKFIITQTQQSLGVNKTTIKNSKSETFAITRFHQTQEKMALIRGLMGAKKIMNGGASAPKGFLAVYVGESKKTRYLVPVSYLSQPSFQDLLRKAEEEFGFSHPMGGLTIPCPEDVFMTVTSQLQGR